MHCAIRQSYRRPSFPLAPSTRPVTFPQASQIADRTANGNRLCVVDRPNQFKIHARSNNRSTIRIQAIAERPGHGVNWNDDIDVAEAELWRNGKPAAELGEPDTE